MLKSISNGFGRMLSSMTSTKPKQRHLNSHLSRGALNKPPMRSNHKTRVKHNHRALNAHGTRKNAKSNHRHNNAHRHNNGHTRKHVHRHNSRHNNHHKHGHKHGHKHNGK